MRRTGLIALLVALVVAAGLGSAPSAQAQQAIGGPLDQAPATQQGCEVFWLIGPMPTTCSMYSPLLQAPRGSGVLTEASVRTGPRTGPMRFIVIRAMRSQAVPPGQNPTGVACCASPIQSQVFTPPPNQTVTVPVSLPMLNTVTDIDGEPVEIVDYLGIAFDLNTSLPLVPVQSQIPLSSVHMPALPQTNELIPDHAPAMGMLTINGTVCPSRGTAVMLTGERAPAAVTCPSTPPPPPSGSGITRMSGPDREATAAAISAATFSPGVPVAFIATGAGFPDALAAGPLAARDGGPILLANAGGLPDTTRAELERLRPERIVVLGGERTVSPAVETALAAFTDGPVTRLHGPDRYATAEQIANQFGPGVPLVFVATGGSFPDALAGAAAASDAGAPIVLVDSATVPAASRSALERLAPDRTVVLGGTSVVSPAVVDQLEGLARDGVQRIHGPDRYATAAGIAALFDAPVDTVVVATGRNFPDALAGTPAAARWGAPILLVEPDHVPEPITSRLAALSPRQIVVLGGPGAVGAGVLEQLRPHLRGGQ